MSELYSIWAFITAFWTTVVVQCAKPVNWDQCSKVNDWLVPWARDVMDMHKNGAYHSERKILKQSDGLGDLDADQALHGGAFRD